MLHYIIPSKTRRKILTLFFQNPKTTFHLRKVCREIEEEVNSVKRELDILEKATLLIKEKRFNKSLYRLNQSHIFFDDFLRIIAKETGLAKKIRNQAMRLGKIKFAALSYAYAKKEKISENEVYLLLVGIIVGPEIARIIKEEEEHFPFEINYTIMTREEFSFRKKKNDPFIWGFLKKPKIMIIGNEDDLMAC